jgi:hypothetical protein
MQPVANCGNLVRCEWTPVTGRAPGGGEDRQKAALLISLLNFGHPAQAIYRLLSAHSAPRLVLFDSWVSLRKYRQPASIF